MPKRRHRDETNYIVVHCAATTSDMDVTAAQVDRWHRQRGWFRIGYHFFIRQTGVLEYGEDVFRYGAHVRGHNFESVGICLAGGLGENGKAKENFTEDQYMTLAALIKALEELYPEAKLVGHCDLDSKKPDCPGFDLEKFREKYL